MKKLLIIGFLVLTCQAVSVARAVQAAEMKTDLKCEGCNLVIISLDTLRADRLGVYGYSRDTSPVIDKFANDSLIFERAYSCSSKTAESHMSLFTGLYPSTHGVSTIEGNAEKLKSTDNQTRTLSPNIQTLAEVMHNAGYETAGFHDGGNVSAVFGFDRGFDLYRKASFADPASKDEAVRWLSKEKERFLLFLHTYHVHSPYTPEPQAQSLFSAEYNGSIVSNPNVVKTLANQECANETDCFWWAKTHRIFWQHVDSDSKRDRRHVSDLYDAEIWELDARFEKIVEALKPRMKNTIVVLLSDHGEEFLEHGNWEHSQLYNEVLHVPLIIRHPKVATTLKVKAPVSLVDLAPTLLEWLGLPAFSSSQGQSLTPVINGVRVKRPILAELPSHGRLAAIVDDHKLLLRSHDWTLRKEKAAREVSISQLSCPLYDPYVEAELYNIKRDFAESDDLIKKSNLVSSFDHESCTYLNFVMPKKYDSPEVSSRKVDAPTTDANAVELSPDTIRELESLGYL